jgi:2-dehydropantoate 2-reductase
VGSFQGTAEVDKVESGDVIRADLCVIAVKAYHLSSVSGPASLSTPGRCVCLTNGMGLQRAWGGTWTERVEPAVLTAGFALVSGNCVQTSDGELVVSRGGDAEKLFRASSIPVRTTDDIEALRWGKWIVNSVINPLGAITGLPNNRLLEAGLEDTLEILFEELLSAVPDGFRSIAGTEALAILTRLLRDSSNRCSMLQDIEAGRPTEIDYLTGLCATITAAGCPACECLAGLVRAVSRGG